MKGKVEKETLSNSDMKCMVNRQNLYMSRKRIFCTDLDRFVGLRNDIAVSDFHST